MNITKIVITGGPCGGKTTAMSWIRNEFEKKGYKVLFIPETATELISGGVAPWTCSSNLDFQKCQVRLQCEKENIFAEAAGSMDSEKVLIVCDRGIADNRAYMTDEEYSIVMKHLDLNEIEARDQYDAVFHLVTAAKGASEAYTLSNNQARTETPEEAIELDDKVISAWTGHPYLRVIDNSSGFEQKLRRLVGEISAFLGEGRAYERERRYLIKYPDTVLLEVKSNCEMVEIEQIYLKRFNDTEVRLRKRGSDGNYLYFKTEKTRVDERRTVEIERRISWREYETLKRNADPSRHVIKIKRFCLTENSRYFEIDIYPEWTKQAILGINMSGGDESFEFPEGIELIRELTGNEEYSNYQLAKQMPDEDR